MADISNSLSLPFILPNQAQKHVTHNEALQILDVVTQLAVVSDDAQVPPAAPAEGTRYIVGLSATGAWSGHDGEVALFETEGWRFFVPRAGWRAFVIGRETLVAHDGVDWIDLDSDEVQDIDALGLGMTAPPETPFSAKLNAALWTALYQADGGDGSHISTLNKENLGNDAGFVLQQDFQTRALIGLFGSNDLRMATTPDGSTFFDGLTIDNSTGIVSQPALPRFKGSTNFDNYCPADAWTRIAINDMTSNDQAVFDTTGNTFTAPVSGTYQFGATLTFKENASSTVQTAVRLVVNGTDEIDSSRCEVTGIHLSERTTVSVIDVVPLNSGDTVEVQGKVAGSDGYFAADRSSFWGLKIG